MQRRSGNRANRNEFIDIVAETKELTRVLIHAVQRMPKIERVEGPGVHAKQAVWDIIDHYYVAWFCPERRMEEIGRMIGAYGRLQTAFELCLREGLVMESLKLPIAERMERIERGIMKWNNAQSAQRQAGGRGTGDMKGFGVAASDSV